MKNFNNKSGFTLIEVIVVMLIIGILAAIALPNLFSNVTKSKGSTAVSAMDGVKTAFEACAVQNNVAPPTAPCAFATVSSLPTTIATASNGFYFGIAAAAGAQSATSGQTLAPAGSPSGNNLTYSIIATDASGNVIALNRAANGTFTCSAPNAGSYQGVC